MEQKLTGQEIIKLIGLYRSHALLWDMNSQSYRRNDLKVKAYEDIALQMGTTADIVKKKIRALRSTYTGEKKKVYKKSGSATEEVYVSSLFWFNEMSFLDSSISVRKSWDNSKENNANLLNFEDYIEESISDYNESFPNKTTKGTKKEESSKFDEALEKLIEINGNENEFTAFGTSLGFQLQKFPEEDAYELMGEIQNLLTQRKLKNMRKRKFQAIQSEESSWYPHSLENSTECSTYATPSTSKKRSSTPFHSDILSSAISDAEIDFTAE